MRPASIARLAVLLLALALLAGCYVLRQGTALLGNQARARRLEAVLADQRTSEATRSLLRLVEQVRRYGTEEIGLEANRNYTKYVSLDRDYLVSVVSASEADSFRRKTWWFPFFGSFPYKGFYRRADAERLARRLERRGLDVIIRKVDAFSTLGFFRDPVYSFMEDYPVFEIADLILHEQTHATIFLKNRVQFNEELASFVGTVGALDFVRHRYGEDSEVYREAVAVIADRDVFLAEIRSLHDELSALYASDLPRTVKLGRKESVIREHQERFEREYDRHFRSDRYRGFSRVRINNAYLNLFMTYNQDLEVFYRLHERTGGDLRATVELLRGLKGKHGDPKELIRGMLQAEAGGSTP